MARIRTLDFLPEIFQTSTNSQFLAATLDQIVSEPNTTRIQGYIGSTLGHGVNALDYYVTEPTKTRTDYQLDPSVVFTKPNVSIAQDFITYPGIIDALKMQGAITDNNSELFQSQFYSWDSFTNLDKLINYNEYYWLPAGPPAVVVAPNVLYNTGAYVVTNYANQYGVNEENEQNSGATNPTLTLLRGGTYTFSVNQNSGFYIQTEPGTSGYSPTQPNIPTRDVYGVSNNGAETGFVTFEVPTKSAQDEYIFPGNNVVDVVSTTAFEKINGQLLNTIVDPQTGVTYPGVGAIDGINIRDGLRVLFYNTGVPSETGYISSYFNETGYDQNDPYFTTPKTVTVASTNGVNLTLSLSDNVSDLRVNQTITFNNINAENNSVINAGMVYFVISINTINNSFTISDSIGGDNISLNVSSGTMVTNINEGQYQQGFYSTVSEHFYVVQLVGDPANPVIRLLPDGTIPNKQNITPTFGTQWISRKFYRNDYGVINLVPNVTANLDVLYYQDGTNPNKVGTIRLVDTNSDNFINVITQILGKQDYTSPTGVVFTNGLKVIFEGNVYPEYYQGNEYYVEGVGTSIELLPVKEMTVPERYTIGVYIPWDSDGYSESVYDINLNVPVEPDYITIARNSINKNAWSRSNRWFHSEVINATATYNNDPSVLTTYATLANKAKRPIVEFYPNLKLFNSGSIGKRPVDFFDTRTSDAFSNVAGVYNYYPDTEVYTQNTAVIAGTVVETTTTTIAIPTTDIVGAFQLGMYVGDYYNVLPNNTQIESINIVGSNTVLTVTWSTAQIVDEATLAIVGTDTTVNNYAVFAGSRIIFANDSDNSVRDKIYVVDFAEVQNQDYPILVLSPAEDAAPVPDEMVAVNRGYNYQGKSFYYIGSTWIAAQQKATVNQAPLFDVFDKNGISLGDSTVYNSTSFLGSKLFSYALGSGIEDPILGFPIKYSSVSNVGDIQFEADLNSQTFNYVRGFDSITQNINTGYVHNTTGISTYERLLGWQTAVAPSVQYQAFSFDFDPENPYDVLDCDIAVLPDVTYGEKGWARHQVFFNNVYREPSTYTVETTANSTSIILTEMPAGKTVIQVLLLSDQTSNSAYYIVPANLNNNPFNEDITSVNLGDIRMHYADMFINAPDTTGDVFGVNNFRDCGDLVPYGTKIIQNSASLVLPGAFLRRQENSLIDSLLFNSREYIKYKQLLVDTVQNTEYTQRYSPAQILDDAIDQIAASRSEINAFFWSDMLPAKSPYKSTTYSFNSMLDVTRYPLSQVYDFTSANYNGVLVYLTRIVDNIPVQYQLLKNVDYTISTDSPTIVMSLDMVPGDKITVNEYNQTYGSYVPNTPSKLGLYRLYQPSVVMDNNYSQPTYFIKGHDGSYTKLYGQYIPELDLLIDFRDQALLEFEKRIYNNTKLDTVVPIQLYDVMPGFFRTSNYSWDQWMQMYSTSFLNWVGQNRVDYKTQYYQINNDWTYNYTNSANKLNSQPIKQGYWRGLYEYFYDTTTPNATPWEMLGFTEMPSWWTERYGPAPYTSGNTLLWTDLENGFVWNNGDSYTVSELARPGLSNIIPVDGMGNLLSPLYSIVGTYNPSTFQKDWVVGDDAPVELSYRRSSSYPFDIVRLFALTRPAEFYNLGVDLDNYKYNSEFNQYLVNDRSHLVPSDIEIYGNGTAKTSYINWIVDFQKQLGVDATTSITTLLDNLDVRLAYRLAGFSDKTLLKFYVEKSSPNSSNAALLIPDESYSVLLYENQPFEKLAFSSVIVQQTNDGWTVYGNAQNFAYFTVLQPENNGKVNSISVGTQTVKVSTSYTNKEVLVPYGTKFYSTQEIAQFIMSYAAFLTSKGMIFNDIQVGQEINWNLMVQEFLYWVQTGWEEGSVLTLNPAATMISINKESTVIQPLTVQNQNFILNQNLYPIQLNDLCVNREETSFIAKPMNEGDSLSFAQFNMSNIEHGIVFDNVTLFNDTIYNLVTGLRQNRINVSGVKTAEWNGTINAWGFILNQDNVKEWSRDLKYPKGIIVKYKNKYWTALTVVEPSNVFDETKWKLVNYQDIQKGMLPNAASRAYESTLYYNVDQANLEQDADLLSYSLIGYRPRDYLALADLTDITQINVYKNMIKNKGTKNATYAFKGANLPQGGIDYEVYENWAIKVGEYGGVLNENFVEFKINQNLLTGNPSIVSLTDGMPTEGSMQEVPLYNLYNYGRPIDNPNVLSTMPQSAYDILYPAAGYANFDDVRMSSFYYAGLPNAVDSSATVVPINEFYVRDYMWLANYKERWGVYSWTPVGEIVQVRSNLNNTTTVTFSSPHGLKKLDSLSIINFAANVDGYYIVNDVVNLNEVIINLVVPNTTTVAAIQGRGIGLGLVSQRVEKPSDIASMNLLDTEFTKNTVWVDENSDGNWAVFRKGINYSLHSEMVETDTETYGNTVAYSPVTGYFVADSANGKVYRYLANNGLLSLVETLESDPSFGTSIAVVDNIVFISQPTSGVNDAGVYVYVANDTVLTDNLVLAQTIPATVEGTWGNSVTVSDDSNWVFVADSNNVAIDAYRKSHIVLSAGYFVVGETYTITNVGDTDFTLIGAVENSVGITFVATGIGAGTGTAVEFVYDSASAIDGTGNGYTNTDKFGFSISTDHNGDAIFVGAPDKDSIYGPAGVGEAAQYQRMVQKFEAPFSSIGNQPQFFKLVWTPTAILADVQSTNNTGNTITLSSTGGIEINDPVIFSGTGLTGTGIEAYKVYYVSNIAGTDITIKSSRSTSLDVEVQTVASIIDCSANIQTETIDVYVNGSLVADSNYAVITAGDYFVYTGVLTAGDIIEVNSNQFVFARKFNPDNVDRIDTHFGYALDSTKWGSELLIGAPYEIDSINREGQVHRFTNAGAKYGVVIGNDACNITGNSVVLINGYAVYLTAGSDAKAVATTINDARVTNIQASYTSDNKLIIQVADVNLAEINEKLMITANDSNVLSELGIQVYNKTQVITCPHEYGPTQFGKAIQFDNTDSVVIGAPVATRFSGTTFDFTDDENLHNDTVFDNNATRFVDEYQNAGAAYMFDLLSNYNGSLTNPGMFVYAQSVNSINQDVGLSPMYGASIAFNDNVVMIGSPSFYPTIVGGQVTVYNNSLGVRDWTEFRQSAPVVDIERIQNTQLFSALTNDTLVNLDYMDPLQGKLLGVVRENIDYVAKIDPAMYNTDSSPLTGSVWGAEHVGQIWFNTNSVRYVNYHQNDVVYNSKHWGTLFPGSDVAVYTWVASNTVPSSYEGPGTPYSTTSYSVGSTLNASNIVTPVYYFWVRNSNIIDQKLGKTLSDNVIASYIANPQSSGVAYMAPLLQNTFALYNSASYIQGNNTVFHVGFANATSGDTSHSEYTLIRENYNDDFLPGFPTLNYVDESAPQHGLYTSAASNEPRSLYARMIDSLSGCSTAGEVVPDPFLPLAVQTGVLVRPRQSFFYNRLNALKNYLEYANAILKQYPITELKPDISFLFAANDYYDTTGYWEYINWWADGYNDTTRSTFQVPVYGDLVELTVAVGTIAKVEQNGAGLYEIYRYDGSGVWTRVGLQNGTIQFKSSLWDYDANKIGFGGDFFDTVPYDTYPSTETRYIIRALNEQIYTGDLISYRNKSLLILFEYIQSETTESQNFLPWINKTSLVDVSHKVRELKPYEVFKSDNEAFLEGYINEVKPYRVVVKEFLINYTGSEVYEGTMTDFDLPAVYNTTYNQFITPQLVTGTPTNQYEYNNSSDIWQTAPYIEWFNNRGLSLTGQDDVLITRLSLYIDVGSNFISVDNSNGFPTNGVVRIDDELIAYSYVDRALNILTGLVRGYNGTLSTQHLPGAEITMDLPAIVVLDGGRGYIDPPAIEAYIDTSVHSSPIVPAQLQAVMSGGTVSSVEVINPGQGYEVLPEIRIAPSYEIYFSDTAINSALHTLNVYAPNLHTGDQIRFKAGTNGVTPSKIIDGDWYYVNVLETVPSAIVALYSSYADAIKDQDRIAFAVNGQSDNMALLPGARATTITSAMPIRENIVRMKFDRTAYTSKVIDWVEGAYYGAYFAGVHYNPDQISSSAYTLQNTTPDINTIYASAQGAVFDVVSVDSDTNIEWSSYKRYVAATVSSNNSIVLIPQDNNNPPNLQPTASGSTIGMVKNMPVKFVGQVVGGLTESATYFVSSVLSETEFTVSETIDGPELALSSATPISNLLSCYTGETISTTVLTVNYPGILAATKTTATTNAITVPMSAIGTSGTNGFYPELSVFFTGDVFGGLVENRIYYVTTVIDNENFTISESPDLIVATAYETEVTTNLVTVSTTSVFSVNDPVIFSGATFGGIQNGALYYVKDIVSDTQMTLSTVINGAVFVLTTASGEVTVTNQVNTVQLTNGTGEMTLNVSLPISPGQVNGQKFNMYATSGQYPNVTANNFSNLISSSINATLSGVNRIAFSTEVSTSFFYVNMPVRFTGNVGNLSNNITYYITEYSGQQIEDPMNPGQYISRPNIQVTVTNTSSVDNVLTCDTTESLYIDMPIVFSGFGLGGVNIDQEYYIAEIVSATKFKLKDKAGVSGTVVTLTNATGSMVGTGDQYIVVSVSIGGSPVTLDPEIASNIRFVQYITSYPTFDLSYVLGGYNAIVTEPGTGFAINDVITVPGTAVGGVTPGNDITMRVNTIGSQGEIIDVICEGTVPVPNTEYYMRVRTPNTLAVYSNPGMSVPVPVTEFPYTGFTSATVTSINTLTNTLVIADTSVFSVNDRVVFTGEVADELIAGSAYFIYEILSSTEFTVTTVPGSALDVVDFTMPLSATFTIAKAGSIAFLPEPFFFNQSIVRFNNRLYICVVSNNDTEFVIGKWELLRSDSPLLNAMDRTVGYYSPTVNMPGLDLTQLFDGVTYPNPTIRGNNFQPDEQYPLDTIVTDIPFYPSQVDMNSVIYNNGMYFASANLPGYSAIVVSPDGTTWGIGKLTNFNVDTTSISYNNGYYLVTSNNSGTPIFKSVDGINWSTTGNIIPYGTVDQYGVPVVPTPIITAGLQLNGSAYRNGKWVAVGKNIVASSDMYTWKAVTNFNSQYNYVLYDVVSAGLTAFSGFVAVGKGLRPDSTSGYTQLVDTVLALNSTDGETWTETESFTDKGLYGVAANGSIIVAVGEDGVIYYSLNGSTWLGSNEVLCNTFNASTNQINVTSTAGFAVNDAIRFNQAFGAIDADTTYYVKSIDSATQLTVSETEGGSVKEISNVTAGNFEAGKTYVIVDAGDTNFTLIGASSNAPGTLFVATGAGTGTGVATIKQNGALGGALLNQTLMSLYPSTTTLRDVTWTGTVWVAVGDLGLIKTSTDGIIWTAKASGTTENLSSVTYNESTSTIMVTGDNNIIISSIDGGTTWTSTAIFEVAEPLYTVKGADFPYGYGPEELVPGNITDNLAFAVSTRPGVDWPVVEYGHTGFNVVSREFSAIEQYQTQYYFGDMTETPINLMLQVVNGTTLLGTTLYPSEYTVDWVNKIVTLNEPLSYFPVKDILRIDVYEVGNGNQLVKANTDTDPIRLQPTSGFTELYVNCNYSADIAQGGGIIRTGSSSVVTLVTATEATTDRIQCESVSDFALNRGITFQGVTFGGIEEDVTYYVKSISYPTNSITVSLSLDPVTGVAQATVPLTTASGSMYANIENGNGALWTAPIVYHNGTKLVLGINGLVTRTKSSTNTITTNSTVGLYPGTPIAFCACSFGGIVPFVTYYVKSFLDSNEFTISATVNNEGVPGDVFPLEDASGTSAFITNDYAFGIQPDNVSAKIMFPVHTYTNETDYIVYSLFGETVPEQYGYTVPEIQTIIATGDTEYQLDNFVGGENAINAIVEVDGLRLVNETDYLISFVNNTITFTLAPSIGSVISVLTYNDTSRQYLNTQYNVTGEVNTIATISNEISEPITGTINQTSSTGNLIRVNTDAGTAGFIPNLIPGQVVIFKGTSFGGIATDGTVYYVDTVPDSTHFTIKDFLGNQIVLTDYTAPIGSEISFEVGGQPTVRITTTLPHLFVDNDVVRMDDILGSTQLNNNVYYVKYITPTQFDIYLQPYDVTQFGINYPVTSVNSYVSGGYVWKEGTFFLSSAIATATTSGTNVITVDSTESLVLGTPVYFNKVGYVNGDELLGGIIQGDEYFVRSIIDDTTFTVSSVRYGDDFVLTNDTGTMNVIQWAQTSVDRLWVTINGERVPSSKLRLNDYNEVSILHKIANSDTVVITSMIPTATPNEQIYLNLVNNLGEGTVYNSNAHNRTWLTKPVYELDDVIYVYDVGRVTNTIVEVVNAPSITDGYYYIGLNADKRILSAVTITNNTTGQEIASENYEVLLVSIAPQVKITPGDWINEGDSLTLTMIEGTTIFINGEQIRFSVVDKTTNTLSGLQRGVNGTAMQTVIQEYTDVFALLSSNQLPAVYYDQTWNSYVYNTVEGDPLQISETVPAVFLSTDM